MYKALLLKYILYSLFLVTVINHSHSVVAFNPFNLKTFVRHVFRQQTKNSEMELHWKGLCLQEFTILLDFSVKSFVELTISMEKFHRFQK